MKQKLKVLLIARHFPPHISGGARRPYLLAKELMNLGCTVNVFAPGIPDDIEGFVVPHPMPVPNNQPAQKPSLRDFARTVLLWPDADIRWSKIVVRAVKENLPFQPDWIITTSPPESIHHAGRILKEHYNCKWLIDFRDFWLQRPLRPALQSPIRRLIERQIAQKYCQSADLMVAVDKYICEETKLFAPKVPAFVLPHCSLSPPDQTIDLPENRINLVHTGSFSLSDLDRKIEQLKEDFVQACKKNPSLLLHLAGRLTEQELAFIDQELPKDNVKVLGILPIEEALALQRAADGLLLVGSPYSDVPPGKYAEYRQFSKPIITVGKARWIADVNGTQNALELLIDLKKGSTGKPVAPTPTPQAVAKQLLGYFEKIQSQ
ncbi:MAG: hypothetical protein JKY46_10545 [Robiginitomaculum sp.]|nr:hypothetical protein [Robiginitomaculum sp.]